MTPETSPHEINLPPSGSASLRFRASPNLLRRFQNDDECLEKARYYLDHDAERLAIAAAGSELVRQRHRYEDRVADILQILSGETALVCPSDPVVGA